MARISKKQREKDMARSFDTCATINAVETLYDIANEYNMSLPDVISYLNKIGTLDLLDDDQLMFSIRDLDRESAIQLFMTPRSN